MKLRVRGYEGPDSISPLFVMRADLLTDTNQYVCRGLAASNMTKFIDDLIGGLDGARRKNIYESVKVEYLGDRISRPEQRMLSRIVAIYNRAYFSKLSEKKNIGAACA